MYWRFSLKFFLIPNEKTYQWIYVLAWDSQNLWFLKYYPFSYSHVIQLPISSQEIKWNIFLLHKYTHKHSYFELTWIRNNFLPDSPQVQFNALKSFPKIIEQAQFVTTRVVLNYSMYCVLLSKTFVVNALGMLAIPHQNSKI